MGLLDWQLFVDAIEREEIPEEMVRAFELGRQAEREDCAQEINRYVTAVDGLSGEIYDDLRRWRFALMQAIRNRGIPELEVHKS